MHTCYANAHIEIQTPNHYIQYMIADALQDLKNAALSGKSLNFQEVAEDYGLNAKLLERKFNESFPNGVVALKSSAEMMREKVAAKVSEVCKRYGLDRPLVGERTFKGQRFIVICADRAKRVRPWVAVSLDDARGYVLPKYDV
jgi:AraC-like DNA-binding protein